jgi:hypothetical protein
MPGSRIIGLLALALAIFVAKISSWLPQATVGACSGSGDGSGAVRCVRLEDAGGARVFEVECGRTETDLRRKHAAVGCRFPSFEQHLQRNCFTRFESTAESLAEARLIPVLGAPAGTLRETGSGRIWLRSAIWASVFHKPWLNVKLVAPQGPDFGSSELEAPRSAFSSSDGGVAMRQCRLGSYNYFDYTRSVRDAACHLIADVLPPILYWTGHDGQPVEELLEAD